MKPRLLHTCIGRNVRPKRAPTQALWRPVSLCWPRAARRTAPPPRRAPGIAVHHAAHSTLNLHLHLAAPQPRPAAPARALMRHAIAVTPAHRIGASAPSLRHLIAYRELASDARPNRQVHSVTIRRELASATAAPIAVRSLPPPRVRAIPVARDAAGATCLTPATLATARAVRPAMLTMAHVPRPRPQQVNAAVRTAAPPASHRQTLIWQQPAPPAASPPDAEADTASSSAAGKAAGMPPPVQTVAARTASTTQQLREALGTKLLDGAFTERLADDVMRRVEKRMRIERERRGL